MNKAVMTSVQPKWCELIASGKKTIEVRKTKPMIDVPFKCYIYCTKEAVDKKNGLNRYLHIGETGIEKWADKQDCKINSGIYEYNSQLMHGKVIGEFVCDYIKDITYHNQGYLVDNLETTKEVANKLGVKLADSYEFIHSYLNGNNGYAWHITDLVIYDNPKELEAFNLSCNHNNNCHKCNYWDYFQSFSDGHCLRREKDLTKPPQRWCYVDELT